MGAMMEENHSKLLGFYDELATFLTQINVYKGRGLADSHDLALLLQLYNGNPWTRRTGMATKLANDESPTRSLFQFTFIYVPCTSFTVHGDAHFSMEHTSLTIGGFTQPSVARSLIEMSANAEKGLSQRFLWFFPKPRYNRFEDLEPVDEDFLDGVGEFEVYNAS